MTAQKPQPPKSKCLEKCVFLESVPEITQLRLKAEQHGFKFSKRKKKIKNYTETSEQHCNENISINNNNGDIQNNNSRNTALKSTIITDGKRQVNATSNPATPKVTPHKKRKIKSRTISMPDAPQAVHNVVAERKSPPAHIELKTNKNNSNKNDDLFNNNINNINICSSNGLVSSMIIDGCITSNEVKAKADNNAQDHSFCDVVFPCFECVKYMKIQDYFSIEIPTNDVPLMKWMQSVMDLILNDECTHSPESNNFLVLIYPSLLLIAHQWNETCKNAQCCCDDQANANVHDARLCKMGSCASKIITKFRNSMDSFFDDCIRNGKEVPLNELLNCLDLYYLDQETAAGKYGKFKNMLLQQLASIKTIKDLIILCCDKGCVDDVIKFPERAANFDASDHSKYKKRNLQKGWYSAVSLMTQLCRLHKIMCLDELEHSGAPEPSNNLSKIIHGFESNYLPHMSKLLPTMIELSRQTQTHFAWHRYKSMMACTHTPTTFTSTFSGVVGRIQCSKDTQDLIWNSFDTLADACSADVAEFSNCVLASVSKPTTNDKTKITRGRRLMDNVFYVSLGLLLVLRSLPMNQHEPYSTKMRLVANLRKQVQESVKLLAHNSLCFGKSFKQLTVK